MKKSKIEITKTSTPISSNIKEAIMKKALGYEVSEIVEEYSMVDNELKLVKKKVNTKTYPPDLDAIELALNDDSDKVSDYSMYTDEELLEERHNLLELFRRIKKGERDENNKS